MYIGSAVRLSHRWTEHRRSLLDDKHHSPYLQRAFNKEPEAFYFEVIEEMENPSKEALLAREQFWMDFFQSYKPANGYNVSPTARSCQGIRRSPEMRAKLSAATKGKKMSPERLAIHLARKKPTRFRSFTDQQKQEMRLIKLGGKAPPGTGAKISKALKENPYQARAVYQYDLSGKFLKKYRTILEAERSFGPNRYGIENACKLRVTHIKGFQWRYSDAMDGECDIGPKQSRNGVELRQLNVDGTLVKTYPSYTQAQRETGFDEAAIRAASIRKNNACYGYRWERISGGANV